MGAVVGAAGAQASGCSSCAGRSFFFPHIVSRGPSGEAPTLLELGFASVCCQITVSVMKRRAPDMRQKGESRVIPYPSLAEGWAKGVSGWSVCSVIVAYVLPSLVCVLCNRADEDPDIYGQKSENRGLCTHENCLVSFPQVAQRLPLVLQPVCPQPGRIRVWGCAQKPCPAQALSQHHPTLAVLASPN